MASERVPGGIAFYASLFDENDPAVDHEAPQTEVVRAHAEPGHVVVEASATDDRNEGLAYSFRIDGGSWTSWQSDPTMIFDPVEPGPHTVEVQSRDSWLNVDESPASAEVTVASPADGEAGTGRPKGCGCASTERGGGLLWIAGLILAVVTNRRLR